MYMKSPVPLLASNKLGSQTVRSASSLLFDGMGRLIPVTQVCAIVLEFSEGNAVVLVPKPYE